VAPLGGGFRRLWAASALSNVADGIFQVALPLLAVTLTTRPGLVAGVAFARALPWLFMALPAGALADRLDRRRTMIRVDVLRVVVMGALTAAVAADVASIPLLYAAAFVLGIGETLFDTAAQSILPAIVGRDELSRANGHLQAVELTTNQFVGPPLGGVLAAVALASAFAVIAGAYLAAAVCLIGIAGTFRPAPPSSPTTMRADIAEGLRFVWRNPILRTLGLMLGVTNLAFTAHGAIFVLFAVSPGPLDLSRAGFGVLLATAAVGGVAASAVVVRLERAVGRSRTLVAVVVVFGASLAVPAVTTSLAANVVAVVTAAFGAVTWNVVTVSLRQRITPDHLLGRMNATYRLLGWGTMPLGAALGGAVGEWFGLRPAFAVAALLHVPMLLGFLVVTEPRLATAETASPVDVAPPS
jgi:MFS family permease